MSKLYEKMAEKPTESRDVLFLSEERGEKK